MSKEIRPETNDMLLCQIIDLYGNLGISRRSAHLIPRLGACENLPPRSEGIECSISFVRLPVFYAAAVRE